MTHYDLTSLRLFASVVEQKSISNASRVNNIAASSVSKRVSDLEARVGVPLIYRLKEGVDATPAGAALYRHVKVILRSLDDLESDLSEYLSGVRGHTRLWANPSAITQFLPDDLANYCERFPEVSVELREEVSAAIIEAVQTGAADIGIYSEHQEVGAARLQSRIYRRDTLMVIVPRGHPLEGRQSVTLRDTIPFAHIGLQDGSSLQAKLVAEAEGLSTTLRFRIKVFSFEGIRALVEAGLGLAVLPQGSVMPHMETGRFTALELDEVWATRSLMIGYRDYRSLHVVSRALVECLAPTESRL